MPHIGASACVSFNHFVGGREQRRRHSEAKHPGGLRIDHQLQLGHLNDRQIRRLGTFEDAAGTPT